MLIEPDSALAHRLEETLKQVKGCALVVINQEVSIRQIESYSPDVGIVGPSHNLEQSLRWVQKLKIVDPALPVLVFSNSEALTGGSLLGPFEAVYSLRQGVTASELERAVERVVAQRSEIEPQIDFPILIGKSPEIQKIRTQISRISGKDITVLITGESGTGKELVARSIHYHSPRRRGPLLKINCGALPADLLESEVFGFQQGAFTGAHKNKPGRLELAHNGTLFIDEIGDLSLPLQVKFLQVLEDKSFSRLGGTEERIVDTRVVAATNTDLWHMVKEGRFRKDLYYRLNVVRIEVPPLRRRKEDIPLLVDFFINKYCYELKRKPVEVPSEVLRALEAYDWPGNVRELENIARRAIVLREWTFVFKELDFELCLDRDREESEFDKWSTPTLWPSSMIERYMAERNFSLKSLTKKYVSEIEKHAIKKTLEQTRWNRREAAKLLRVSYKTLLNRIAEFNLRPS